MPTETQNGKALVFGIAAGTTAGITMSGYASFTMESAKAAHRFELDELKDEGKADVSLIATNGRLETDIVWTPTGASKTTAYVGAVMLSPLAKLTLSNFKVTMFNGDWVYIGDESIDLTQAPAKMSIRIRKYDDSTQNASLTTAVS